VKISLETLSHIDVNDLHRLGAFTEVTLWFPAMRLETNRWVVKYFHARSPADRPPQRIPNGHTAPTAERGRGSCACFAIGGSASSIVPMASLVVGRAAHSSTSHSAQGPNVVFT
jgi:hypothetical protein